MIRLIRRHWLGAVLGGGLLLAQPAPLADAVTAHLREFSLLHVEFTQTRHLAALSRPLRSSGSMTMARDRGVLWQLRKPLCLGFVITPRGFREVGGDGRLLPKKGQEAPVLARMGQVLQSLLQGKWSVLEESFTVRAEGRPEKWKISLAPKPQAAAFLKGIQVAGGRFMETVQVQEPGGDDLQITFERPRTADPLTEAEARLLAGD